MTTATTLVGLLGVGQVLVVKILERFLYLVSHPPELAFYKFFRALSVRWVVEADVMAVLDLAEKGRTVFVGTSANCYHVVPFLVKIHFNAIAAMVANVKANLFHSLNGTLV